MENLICLKCKRPNHLGLKHHRGCSQWAKELLAEAQAVVNMRKMLEDLKRPVVQSPDGYLEDDA